MAEDVQQVALIGGLLRELDELEDCYDECRKLLRDWRATSPEESAASPDAVLAIVALKENLRKDITKIKNKIGEGQLPF